MKEAGSAFMGIGAGVGENRAQAAARGAISSPLLEVSIEGARGILFTVTGGPDLTMAEVEEASKIITEHADADANIIFGATINDKMVDQIKITVIATGFDDRRPSIPATEEEQSTSSFFSGGSKFMPSNFMRKVQKDEEEEEKKFKQIIYNNNVPSQTPKPLPPQAKDKPAGF